MPDTEPDAEADRGMTSFQPAAQSSSRWMGPAALVVAVIAIAVGVWALVRSPAEPAVNSQQSQQPGSAQTSDDAKGRVCAAFDIVRKAVSIQTNVDLGPDPVAREAVAANARLATLGGGDYLLSRLDPATPPELADAVRKFANNLQDIGMSQLVGVLNTDPALGAKLSEAQGASEQIAGMCK